MALATAVITYDISDLLGEDYWTSAAKAKITVSTNVPGDTIVDTTGKQIRLGSSVVKVGQDGTGSLSVWIPGAGSNPTSWQTSFLVDYPDPSKPGGRARRTFGPFTITATANLADLIAEQEVPPTYISQVTAQLDAKVTQASGYATNAASSASAAAASAQQATDVITADLGTTDGQTKALIQNPASQTAGALSATIATGADARIAAAPQVVRANQNMVVFGDSFADFSVSTTGTMGAYSSTIGSTGLSGSSVVPWMLAFSQQRIRVTRWAGVGGNRTSQMLARWSTDVAPYLTPGGWVTILTSGTNDVLQGVSTAETTANLTAMYDLAQKAGVRVLTATVPPKTSPDATAAQLAAIHGLNSWLREQAVRRPGLRVADWHAAASDATTADRWREYTSVSPYALTTDGTHPAQRGAALLGKLLFRAIERDLPPDSSASILSYGAADVKNIAGGFTGTGGTLANGVTGTVPDNWTARSVNGSAIGGTAVVSIVPASDPTSPFAGTDRAFTTGPLLKIVNGGGAVSRVQMWRTISGAAMTPNVGHTVRASIGAYLSGVDIAGTTAAPLGLQVVAFNAASEQQIVNDMLIAPATTDMWPTELGNLDVVLKTLTMTLPAGTTSAILKVTFGVKAGTAWFYRPEMRIDPLA